MYIWDAKNSDIYSTNVVTNVAGMYVPMYVRVCMYVHVCVHTYIQVMCTYVCMYVPMYVSRIEIAKLTDFCCSCQPSVAMCVCMH